MIEPRRIMQTVIGPQGNCQSACLAMLLGLDLAAVPNFNDGGPPHEFGQRQLAWLAARGLYSMTFTKWEGGGFFSFPPPGYFITGGVSPRGNRHAVIYRDGELWHDPHPEGGGLIEVQDVDFILPLGFRPALWTEDTCPGHVASAGDAKVCGRCGVDIDSFRPDDD